VLAHLHVTGIEENGQIQILGIPQLINPGEVAEQTLLPSFLYIPSEVDFPPDSLQLPWERH